MAASLSNLVDKFAEGIHKIKHKYDNEKCELCGIKYKDCEYYLEWASSKDDLIEYKRLYWNKNYQKSLMKKNKKKQRFANMCRFSNHNKNTFILLLWKGIYLYEYMEDWGKFNETLLPEKKLL